MKKSYSAMPLLPPSASSFAPPRGLLPTNETAYSHAESAHENRMDAVASCATWSNTHVRRSNPLACRPPTSACVTRKQRQPLSL